MLLEPETMDIVDLLPHKPPMVLLERLLAVDENRCRAEVIIDSDSLFYETGKGVPTWVGIEYMAQAVAAWAGYHALCRQVPVKVGYLLGTRKYVCHDAYFVAEQALVVAVERQYQDAGLGVFQCEIWQAGSLVCEAAINVFQPDDEAQSS